LERSNADDENQTSIIEVVLCHGGQIAADKEGFPLSGALAPPIFQTPVRKFRIEEEIATRATEDGHCLGIQAREARFEGVAGGDLRDETLLTAACQELRAASSKLQRLARHCPTNIQLLV